MIFQVRQAEIHYFDQEVEADTAEDALQAVAETGRHPLTITNADDEIVWSTSGLVILTGNHPGVIKE